MKPYESDPFRIEGMTEAILQHLALLPQVSAPGSFPLEQPILALPTEVQALILLHLDPLSDLSPTCSYLLPPQFWLRALQTSSLFPWLWELDFPALIAKDQHKGLGGTWDWESLVRRLAQRDIHVPGIHLEKLPLGLWNRRRIWRIVEDFLSMQPTDEGKLIDYSLYD